MSDTTIEQFRHRARQFVAAAAARDWDRGSDAVDEVEVARRAQRLLYREGWAGLSWPVAYGGQGLTLREEVVFAQEAAAAPPPILPLMVGVGMVGPALLQVGSEDQKRRWIREILRGDTVWCQLFSEPDAGSDLAAARTRAVRDSDGWRLYGQKVWTSGAHFADLGFALVRTDPEVPKHAGLTVMAVPMRAEGVEVRPLRQINGATDFNEVFLDGVLVPDDHVIGGVGSGWQVALATLANERFSIGAVVSGLDGGRITVGELAAQARAAGLLQDRRIRRRLAWLYLRERALTLLGQRVAGTVLAGGRPGPEGSIAKLVASELTAATAALGLEIAGVSAAGWTEPDEPGAIAADRALLSHGLRIAGGTEQIQRNIIGERILGLPREEDPTRHQPFREVH